MSVPHIVAKSAPAQAVPSAHMLLLCAVWTHIAGLPRALQTSFQIELLMTLVRVGSAGIGIIAVADWAL